MPLFNSIDNNAGSRASLLPNVSTLATSQPFAIPAERQDELSRRIFDVAYSENRGMNIAERIASWATSSAIDLVDTAWGNNLNPFGDRGDMWNLVGDYGGTIGTGLQHYYERNKGLVEGTSGIVGAIGTAWMATSLLLPRISNALANSTAIQSSRIWQAGARMNAGVRANLFAAQREAALNNRAYKMLLDSAGRQYLGMRVAQGAAVGLGEEAAIALTMNANNTIVSDDLSQNLFWSGIGVTMGGAIGGLIGRAESRAIANSDAILAARVEAVDPQGIVGILEGQPSSDVIQQMAAAPDELRGKESAKLTTLLMAARQQTPDAATVGSQAALNQVREEALQGATASLQKIFVRGVQGVPGVKLKAVGPEGKHLLKDLVREDPLAFHGLHEIGLPKVPLDAALTQRTRHIKQIEEAADQAQRSGSWKKYTELTRRAALLKERQPYALVNKSWMPAGSTEAADVSKYVPGQVTTRNVKGTEQIQVVLASGRKSTISSDFHATQNFSKRSITDRMAVVEGTIKMFGRLKARKLTSVLPKNPDWYQLDAAIQHMKQGGKVDFHSAAGYTSVEDMALDSLRKKAIEIQQTYDQTAEFTYWDRLRYNLPLPNAMERIQDQAGDGIRQLLLGALAPQAPGVSAKETLSQLVEAMDNMHTLAGYTARPSRTGDDLTQVLTGNIFEFNRDSDGNWVKPMLAFFDDSKHMKPLTMDGVADAMAELKVSRFLGLTSNSAHPGFVDELTRLLHQMPEHFQAAATRGLADDQITGIGSATSQIVGEFLTRNMRNRDSQIMLSAQAVRETVDRLTDRRINQLFSDHLGDFMTRINSASGSSRVLINQFLSNSSGWDLAENLVSLPNGMYGFELAKSARNTTRLGRKVQTGDMLVNPRTGKEIVVDELGKDFVERFGHLTDDLLADRNRIRAAWGLAPINRRNHFAPPPNTKGMRVAFTLDAADRPVAGGGIVARTTEDFERLKALREKTLPKGHRIVNKEQLEAISDIWDEAAMDFLDPGLIAAPSKGQTGSLSSDLINPHALNDAMAWAKSQVEQTGTGVLRVLYDTQLQNARMRHAIEKQVRGVSDRVKPPRTIFEEYVSTILGKPLSSSEGAYLSPLLKQTEGIIDAGLAEAWPAMRWMAPSQLASWVNDLGARMGMKIQPKHLRNFNSLVKELGHYTPYKDATDYAEQSLGIIRPPEVKRISQKLNTLNAALVLRYLELPHAALNLIGIIATMPALVHGGRAPITATMKNAAGHSLGVVDSMKILAEGTADAVSKRRIDDWKYMLANGDATQQVAELNIGLGLIQDRSSFMRVMLGTGTSKGKKGVAGMFAKGGLDAMISAATDWSENFSRSWSHMIGLRLADYHGIQGMGARHDFAREIANAAIANYAPINRPELFQTSLGSMWGLFMSYALNQNQKLFRWMEKGDFKRAGLNLAMQASLFGVLGTPGVRQITNLYDYAFNDEPNEPLATDWLYARFGPLIGNAIAHGGISMSGLALYTRGDLSIRTPTLNLTSSVAPLQMLSSGAKIVHDTFQSMLSDYSVEDSSVIMESIARNMPNRVMRGMLTTLALDGKDIDKYGQIATENRDWFESAVRMAGLRTTRQQAELEVYYAGRSNREREAARLEQLSRETRSAMRSGKPVDFKALFDKHLARGGRPESFRTWIRNQMRSSGSARGLRDLEKSLRDPTNQLQLWRYGAYGAN